MQDKFLTIFCLGLLSITTCSFSLMTQAQDIQLHGFVSQGIIQNKDSSFVNDDNDFSLDLTEIGLNASYQFLPNLRIAGQAVYLNSGNRFDEGIRVDYLLADWTFYHTEATQSHFYFGRIKNYHWLYSSTRDVPMTRPSIILPQSVYFDGTRDMSVGGDGVSFSHQYASENTGELDFTISSSKASLSSEDTKRIIGQTTNGKLVHANDLQLSLYWQPNLTPWKFGFALTDATFKYDRAEQDQFFDGNVDLQRFYLNAEYFGEKWSMSAELLQEKLSLTGLLFPGFIRETTGQGGFVQAEYKVSNKLQLLWRYERYFADKEDKSGNKLEQSTLGAIPAYFGFQHDATVGFNYDFGCNLKLQLEHHWVKGTARLTPLIIPDPQANPKKHWQISTAQLTYWF